MKPFIFFLVLGLSSICRGVDISVATMNVENLGEQTPGVSKKALRVKEERVSRIAGALLKDLAVFQEVHDHESLERIVQKGDRAGRRKLICARSKLQKTCTVGDQSWFRAIDEIPVEIVESSGSRKALRPFLRTRWKVPGLAGDLVLFAVHLPAAYHSLAMRQEAMIQLTQQARRVADTAALVIAAGDFNTPRKDEAGVHIREYWNLASEHLPPNRGTYYHAKAWHFLDNVLIYKTPGRPAPAAFTDVRIVNDRPFQKLPSGVPARFDPGKLEGVSDHFPLLVRIRI